VLIPQTQKGLQKTPKTPYHVTLMTDKNRPANHLNDLQAKDKLIENVKTV